MKRKSWILLLIAVVGILVAWKMVQREGFDTPPPASPSTAPPPSSGPPPSTTTPAPYVPSSTQPAFREKGASVWGPAFTSFGDAEDGDSVARDPSTIRHPLLLGPGAKGSNKLIDGIGVVESSTAGEHVNLPSSAQTGSNENSKYLPHSRVPGDQDLIPDPYRTGGGEFSTSSYSVKNEPVPFLTDFSAFMK